MATYSSREIISRRIEYTVPAGERWGATQADLSAALRAAAHRFRAEHGIPENAALSDDALWIRPGDDEVIISFTLESARAEPVRAARTLREDDECEYCGHYRSDHANLGITACSVASNLAHCDCGTFVERDRG